MKKICVAFVLIPVLLASSAHGANPVPGSSCVKLGSKKLISAKTYTCVAKGKRLVWDTGILTPNKNGSSGSSSNGLFDAGMYGIVRNISSNGGKSQPMQCQNSDGNQGFRSQKTLFVNPTNPNQIGIGIEYKGFYISMDGGATWKISSSGLIGYPQQSDANKPCHAEFSTLVVDPSNSNHLIISRAGEPGTIKDYFSENAGIYESLDAGKSWKQILTQSGLGVYVHDGMAISAQNPKVIYAGTTTNPRRLNGENKIYATKGVVYRTNDGGKTWAELPTGAPANIGVQSIVLDPTNDQIVTVATFGREQTSTGNQFGPGLGILRSVDGGANWHRIDSLGSGFSILEFSIKNPKYALGITYEGNVVASSDGGATWVKQNRINSMRAVGYNDFDRNGNSGLIADEMGAISIFSENGDSVSSAGTLPSLSGFSTRVTKFAFASDGTWYAAGHYTDNKSHQIGFIFKSIDSGLNWKKILDTDSLK